MTLRINHAPGDALNISEPLVKAVSLSKNNQFASTDEADSHSNIKSLPLGTNVYVSI